MMREADHERIESEASAWVVRLSEDKLSPEQERALAQWRAADPEHESRFLALQRAWGEIPALTGLAGLAPLPPEPVAVPERGARGRRWALGGLATAAAAAGIAFLMPGAQPAPEQHYASALAQSQRIALSDGSIVTLGARSAISVRYTATERRIVLDRGEAFFDVVHDPRLPFLVEAGSSTVRDIGTKFDVKLGAGTTHVAVQEGEVQIARGGAQADAAMLRAGQRAEIVEAGRARIVALPSQAADAWRDGRLVYDNGRLADLVADVNRYYAPGVRLASPSLGELRVTASFRTNEISAFMNALSATLPVEARAKPGGVFEIVAAPR